MWLSRVLNWATTPLCEFKCAAHEQKYLKPRLAAEAKHLKEPVLALTDSSKDKLHSALCSKKQPYSTTITTQVDALLEKGKCVAPKTVALSTQILLFTGSKGTVANVSDPVVVSFRRAGDRGCVLFLSNASPAEPLPPMTPFKFRNQIQVDCRS